MYVVLGSPRGKRNQAGTAPACQRQRQLDKTKLPTFFAALSVCAGVVGARVRCAGGDQSGPGGTRVRATEHLWQHHGNVAGKSRWYHDLRIPLFVKRRRGENYAMHRIVQSQEGNAYLPNISRNLLRQGTSTARHHANILLLPVEHGESREVNPGNV